MSGVEQVLVIPTELFHEVGHFQGVCGEVGPYLERLFDPAQISYRPRDEMELDPRFKQLIPYCLFRHGDHLFQYTRGKLQGEGRLRGKKSVGVGGHICSDDQGVGQSVYREGLERELAEEVRIETGFRERLVGLLNDDLTEVGRVHLGIVHLFEVEEPKVWAREESMLDAGFVPIEALLRELDGFDLVAVGAEAFVRLGSLPLGWPSPVVGESGISLLTVGCRGSQDPLQCGLENAGRVSLVNEGGAFGTKPISKE